MGHLQAVTDRLTESYAGLSPKLRRAAKFALENPADVAMNSMRDVAARAGVSPNTMVRLARNLGFTGYVEFRDRFKQAMQPRVERFPERARLLLDFAGTSDGRALIDNLTTANHANLLQAFEQNDPKEFENVARVLRGARSIYILALGSCFGLGYNFHYVARMALPNLRLLRGDASLLVDGMVDIEEGDVVLAICFEPYALDAMKAAEIARRQGAKRVLLAETRTCPLTPNSDHVLMIPAKSPYFFHSMVAGAALLEAVLAFVIAQGRDEVVKHIDRFDGLRREFGVYWNEGDVILDAV